MPKPIGEFLNDLAQKAGVSADNQHLKDLLAAPELMNVKVPDELISSMDNGLLNIDAAKNNHPDIKKKYFADAFDGIDRHIISLLEDEVFSDDDKADIKAEKSTTKKQELIVEKLKKAKTKATPEDKAAINKQLSDLNETIRKEVEDKNRLKNEYEGKIKNIHLKSSLTSLFQNYKTIYDDLPGSVKSTSLEAMINQALQDNNAELKVDDNGTLQLVGKDGSNVFGSDHRQLTPQSFLDKTLAPILKVSGPPKSVQTTPPAVPTGSATNSFLQSHTQKALAELEQPRAAMT